ncbi:MAG: potassium channel protein [Nitrospinae bacterium]|nr:potassium channel protein [Nitrospinota bacterium]
MTRYRRLIVAFGLLIGVNFALAAGYWLMNRGRTNQDGSAIGYVQSLYMTVISTFTVGYGEMVPIVTPWDQIYTMLVIIIGIGMIGYGLSQMTAFFVEGELQEILGRRKMEKSIAALRDHFIVCGTGDVGHYVIDELLTTRRPLVAIDMEEELLKKLSEERPFPYIVGDATDEAVLERAGIRLANGVMCSLTDDRDNLFLAMTCRLLNPKLRIVAKAHDIKLSQRIRSAGADSVVSPQFIGGLRLVAEMVRPTVVSFLDLMLRDRDRAMRVEEVHIDPGSRLAGKRLNEGDIAKLGLLVMALQAPGSEIFLYVPPPDSVLEPGGTVIVLGDADRVAKLRAEASGTG